MKPLRMPVYADHSHDGFDIFDPVRSTRVKVKFSDNLSFLTAKGCVMRTIHQILHELTYLPGLKKTHGNNDINGIEILLEQVHPNGFQVQRIILRPTMGLGVQRGLLEACGTARQGTGKFHDGDELVRNFPSLSVNEMGCKEITCAAPDESKFLSEEEKHGSPTFTQLRKLS